MTDQPAAEGGTLRAQLTSMAESPGVVAAYALVAEVMPVLEPVWSVLVGPENGIGLLRRLGSADERAGNDSVLDEIVGTFKALDLVGPSRAEVWRILSRPSTALVTAVRNPPLRSRPTNGDRRVRADLGVNGQVVVPAGGQLKVPTPRGCSGLFRACTSSASGLAHPERLTLGDHHVAVV
jgi:hypothetical protein